MPNVVVESKDLKRYFPTGKRRNEKKNLKRLEKQALELYGEKNTKDLSNMRSKELFHDLYRRFEEGKIADEELRHVLVEHKALRDVHGEKLYVKANDGISLSIYEGETVGLVGESGCGKSTYGRTILKLYDLTDGKVIFDGVDISEYSESEMIPLRTKMQIIFQDPYSSLNPRQTVGQIIGEALLEHGIYESRNQQFEAYVKEIMKTCGLDDYMIYRYPHEFSGGQRQRIGIARALALKPKFIVCDEAVSALDVSIQSQIINLLKTLQNDFGMAYLFISHDLSVVKHISDRVGVMYLGDLVEFTDKHALYEKPLHPYTQALLSAVPETDLENSRNKRRVLLQGDIPSNIIVPTGCKFHTRCPIARDKCKLEVPEFREVEPGHFAACHFAGEQI
jgi:peptide/nickel transport system ATP-binding protein/oligopeptide transport system ATP-binding protein